MANKIYELFNPNSDYNKNLLLRLENIQQELIQSRSCYVCKHCQDISDNYTTCHICKLHISDFLPQENTCLLWEEKNA